MFWSGINCSYGASYKYPGPPSSQPTIEFVGPGQLEERRGGRERRGTEKEKERGKTEKERKKEREKERKRGVVTDISHKPQQNSDITLEAIHIYIYVYAR